MKRIIIAMLAIVSATTLGISEEETSAEFFRQDQARYAHTDKKIVDFHIGWFAAGETQAPKDVVRMVTETTKGALGEQWVPSALKIARLESSFNCNATGPKVNGGRAAGVFQVMPKSAKALGYDYSRLHECQYGINAGVAHMKQCIEQGNVKTHAQMAACHVSGWGGWNKKLRKHAQIYRAQYVKLANRKLPHWAKAM